jgi:hypothetical protein
MKKAAKVVLLVFLVVAAAGMVLIQRYEYHVRHDEMNPFRD